MAVIKLHLQKVITHYYALYKYPAVTIITQVATYEFDIIAIT